jgi:hypothetical protein
MDWLCLSTVRPGEARVVVVLPFDEGRGGVGAWVVVPRAPACIGASWWIPALGDPAGDVTVLAVAAAASRVGVSWWRMSAVAPFTRYFGASSSTRIS